VTTSTAPVRGWRTPIEDRACFHPVEERPNVGPQPRKPSPAGLIPFAIPEKELEGSLAVTGRRKRKLELRRGRSVQHDGTHRLRPKARVEKSGSVLAKEALAPVPAAMVEPLLDGQARRPGG
jgi:hypothetical protein